MVEQEKTKTPKEPEVETVSREQYDKLQLDYEKVVQAFNKLLTASSKTFLLWKLKQFIIPANVLFL